MIDTAANGAKRICHHRRGDFLTMVVWIPAVEGNELLLEERSCEGHTPRPIVVAEEKESFKRTLK